MKHKKIFVLYNFQFSFICILLLKIIVNKNLFTLSFNELNISICIVETNRQESQISLPSISYWLMQHNDQITCVKKYNRSTCQNHYPDDKSLLLWAISNIRLSNLSWTIGFLSESTYLCSMLSNIGKAIYHKHMPGACAFGRHICGNMHKAWLIPSSSSLCS